MKRTNWAFPGASAVFVTAVAASQPPLATTRSAEALSFNCFTCHGPEGSGAGSMPALRGRSAEELLDRLRQFRQGAGEPTIMDRIARGYTDEELARIAAYIAGLP